MSDTKSSELSPSIQDREVVFQMLDLGSNKEHQEALRHWVASGAPVINRSWTVLLNREAKNVARVRGYIEKQRASLQEAYAVVEQDMLSCGVSSIIHRTTPQRAHMNWSVRVFSELRTVELPSDASLYEVIHGPLAQAYRIRNYDFSMSATEREAQRRSFAYGNASLDNPRVTRELVDNVADQMKRGG